MIHIKIVGICGSGKSTLALHLRAMGYEAHQIAQEHSGVPDLWLRRNPPDVLVFLETGGEAARVRYPHLNLTDTYLDKERVRLAHAREHADCLVTTDDLNPEQVLTQVLSRLTELGFAKP